jgi:hypothetical protein
VKVCFAGDVFLGGDLLNKSCKNVVEVEAFNKADVRIVNLEQPISDGDFVEDKCTLYNGSFAINQLTDLKINAVNLAHNHIQDKGLDAIEETTNHLKGAGFGYFGAGKNILQAEKPYWLTQEIAVLGYCEFDKPYLKQIEVADTEKPGINPLRISKIKEDLGKLPLGKKAIVFFHWGMEHVWLPPANDIDLAKKLLEDDRIVTIIGMHPHRIQGVISHARKEAYMCLGNFIFPNFYINPPVQIYNPAESKKSGVKFVTRQYHAVHELTYKKWRWVNRVSIVLDFCTVTSKLQKFFVMQDDNQPRVTNLSGAGLIFYKFWFWFLSQVYRLPSPLYKILWQIHAFEVKATWSIQILWFQLKQIGIREFSKKILSYGRKKF